MHWVQIKEFYMSYTLHELNNKEISLREEKFAFTRLSILNSTLSQLKSSPLEKLDIEAIYHSLKISRRTFFNYFPQKSYIMHYLLSVWVYEISLEFEKIKDEHNGLELLHEFIGLFNCKLKEDTHVSKELIRQLFNMKLSDIEEIQPFNKTEKLMIGLPAEHEIPSPYSFNHIIEFAINKAIKENQLPLDTSVNEFCMLIQSLILGTLQILLLNNHDLKTTNHFKTFIDKQLNIYINGIIHNESNTQKM